MTADGRGLLAPVPGPGRLAATVGAYGILGCGTDANEQGRRPVITRLRQG